jgi:CxxC-x17-CxxC domain-containing protein
MLARTACFLHRIQASKKSKEVKKLNSRYEDRPRRMYKITCSDCGKEAEVPFKPTEGRPVYCRECFQKHRKY